MKHEEQNAVSIKIYDGSGTDEAALTLICEYKGSAEQEGRPELSLLEEAALLLSLNEKRWSVPEPAGENLTAVISYANGAQSTRLDIALDERTDADASAIVLNELHRHIGGENGKRSI